MSSITNDVGYPVGEHDARCPVWTSDDPDTCDCRDEQGKTPRPWPEGPMALFDLETTGPDPLDARIVTAMAAECARHGLPRFECSGPVIDGRVLDQHVDRWRKGKRTLTDVAAHYEVRLDGAHDATEDALAAGRVAWKIARQYPAVATLSLAELHEAQAGWHADHQRSFADYLRTKVLARLEREIEIEQDPTELVRKTMAAKALRARADDIDAVADQWPIRTAGGAL
jgi:DNA polymerase III epsilon subunit-like protein